MAKVLDITAKREAQLLAAYAKTPVTYEEAVAHDAMVTNLDCAETAKLVRAALKTAFPGVKFGVTSSLYSGGASIDVKWTDGPTTAEVDPIIKRYERSTFDGMTDSRSYHGPTVLDGRLVRFGADHIMSDRDVSYELLSACAAKVAEQYGVPAPKVTQKAYTWRGKTHISVNIDRDGSAILPDGSGLDRTAGDRAFRMACATSVAR